MEKKSKKSIIIGITSLLLVTLILLGLTYAYYRTRIIGNTNDKSISVTSKKLELTYIDGNGIIAPSELIEPGYSASKTFSVENTGDESASYSIMFDNFTSTFTRNDWTYKLYSGTEAIEDNLVSSGTLLTDVRDTYQIVIGQITVASGVTDEYLLVVTYENLTDVDQSIDMGASLSLRVNIAENTTTWDSATEGTLLYALRENNEVVEPLTVPGKAPSGVTYTETNGTSSTKSITAAYQTDYYYAYADSYTFDEESGTFSLNNPKVATYAEVSTNLANKYVTSISPNSLNSTSVSTTTGLSSVYLITNAPATSVTSSVTIGYTLKIATQGTISEAVLSSTEDDYGTSYYYRGSVENNYVNYAGMCWRIVRVQGDGGIKLILADRDNGCKTEEGYDAADGQSALIVDPSTQIFSYRYDAMSLESDLVYETSGIPPILNAWANGGTYDIGASGEGTFTQKISQEEQEKLSTTWWCNDTSKSSISRWGYDSEENLVYDEKLATNGWYANIYYGASGRLRNIGTAEPNLKCNARGIDDTSATRYTSNIGILSADEVAFAGGAAYKENNSYYLYTNANADIDGYYMYWTLSPESFENEYGDPGVWGVLSSGELNSDCVHDGLGSIRPSVVLRSDVTIVSGGNGTQNNPYVIS